MSDFEFDLFVIGGGSGGVRAGRIAANHGARVAVAEEYQWGGTCVVRGCVPKKLLVYASRFRDEFEDSQGFGFSLREPSFDWPTLIANKDREIERISGVYRSNLERAGAKVFSARAELLDANTLRLQPGGRTVTAKTILVATGGRPLMPETPGIGHAITSNEAFHLEEMPSSIVIVGGGYIAVEFAGIFNGLGVNTTLIYRRDKILRGFDEDLRDALQAEMFKRGIDIRCGVEIASIEKGWSSHTVTLTDGSTIDAGQVMYATGRSPNTEGLGLEAAGVQMREDGAIIVDEHSRTNVPNIYAVGDVTNRINLTPVAIREGHAFADSVFGGKPVHVNYDMVPTAVFSTPEVGTVGMPEHAARERHGELRIFKAHFRPLKNTISGRDERTLMKLVVDAASDRILGCHVLGPDAGEIIQMAAIALRMGATKADFDSTMALHPSSAEELVTMRDPWVPPAQAKKDAAAKATKPNAKSGAKQS